MPPLFLRVFLVLLISRATFALPVAYCSPQNVAETGPTRSIYMSNGFCQDQCRNYVFAIIAGQNCYCSNDAPYVQVDINNCRTPCPGYPPDSCGNTTAGYYAYFNLGGTASSTVGGAAASTLQSLQSAATIVTTSGPPIPLATPSGQSSSGSSASSALSSSSSTSSSFTATNVAAIEQYILSATASESGSTATEGCFISLDSYSTPAWYEQAPTQVRSFYSSAHKSDPATCTALSAVSRDTGLSKGAKAGIIVGSILGALLIAAIVIFLVLCVRGRRRQSVADNTAEKRNMEFESGGAYNHDQQSTAWEGSAIGSNQPEYPGAQVLAVPEMSAGSAQQRGAPAGTSYHFQATRDQSFIRAVAAHGAHSESHKSSDYETPMERQPEDRELIAQSPWNQQRNQENLGRASPAQTSYVLQQQNPYRLPPENSTQSNVIPRKPVALPNRLSGSSLTALPPMNNNNELISDTNRTFYDHDDDYPYHAR